MKRLEAVFRKLSKAGLELKLSKCEFFKSEITYLGHIVSSEEDQGDTAVAETRDSHTGTKIYWTNYYWKFIHNYAKVAKPLHQLVSGDNAKLKCTPVQWTEECEELFCKLKELCSNTPVLAYPDYTKNFKLYTHASESGLGAVLTQVQEDRSVTDQFHEYLYGGTFDVYTDNNPLTYILTNAKLDAIG